MMKLILILFSIGSFVPCFGQNWHLNKVDESQEYPFEYWFQFEHLDDTSTYKLTTQSGKQHSTIRLFDNQDDTLIFERISIVNLATQTETDLFSDADGRAEINLKNGNYRIEVITGKYDDFQLEFDIENDEQIELFIKLGLAPEVEVYQIDSKTALEESQILEIIECVRENQREFDLCARAKNYYVMLHI